MKMKLRISDGVALVIGAITGIVMICYPTGYPVLFSMALIFLNPGARPLNSLVSPRMRVPANSCPREFIAREPSLCYPRR